MVLVALLRESQLLSAAHEKRFSQLGLQLLNSVAHGRLRHKQLVCGVRVIFQFRQQKKGLECIGVHQPASCDKIRPAQRLWGGASKP